MDYASIHVKIRKDGKWLDHWSELEIEEIIQVKKMVSQLELEMDGVIFEKDHARFMKETA